MVDECHGIMRRFASIDALRADRSARLLPNARSEAEAAEHTAAIARRGHRATRSRDPLHRRTEVGDQELRHVSDGGMNRWRPSYECWFWNCWVLLLLLYVTKASLRRRR